MINNIIFSNPELFTSPVSNYYPAIYQDHNNPSLGTIRVKDGGIEACTGSGIWTRISCTAHINVNPAAVDGIKWAIDKMNEERQLKELSEKFPTVKQAMDQVTQAQEQLKVIAALCQE